MLISRLDNVPTVTCGLTKIITCMRTFETAMLQNDHKERRLDCSFGPAVTGSNVNVLKLKLGYLPPPRDISLPPGWQ